MARRTKVSRKTLANYAALLGRGSLAYAALVKYDDFKVQGIRAVIYRTNNSFVVEIAE